MLRQTDDLRITEVRPLIPPAILLEEIPLSERASNVVSNTRIAVGNVLKGRDPRLGGVCRAVRDPRYAGGAGVRAAAGAAGPALRRSPRRHHADLFREAAHLG